MKKVLLPYVISTFFVSVCVHVPKNIQFVDLFKHESEFDDARVGIFMTCYILEVCIHLLIWDAHTRVLNWL